MAQHAVSDKYRNVDSNALLASTAAPAVDRQGEFVTTGHLWDYVIGKSGYQLEGKTFLDFLEPGFADVFQETMHNAEISRSDSIECQLRFQGELQERQIKFSQVSLAENTVYIVRDVSRERRVEGELNAKEHVVSVINHMALSLFSQESVEEIAWKLAEECIGQLGFVDCVVYLLDESKTLLNQVAAYGVKAGEMRQIVSPIQIPITQGIVGRVAQSGVAEIVEDTTKDSAYIEDVFRGQSELTVPIVNDGVVIGVIDSEHYLRGFFTEEHKNVIATVCSFAANKITRLWAMEAIQRSERHLEALIGSLDDIVFEFDKSHRFVNVWVSNPDNLMHTPEYYIGKEISEVYPKHISSAFKTAIDKVFQTKKPLQMEVTSDMPIKGEWYLLKVNYVGGFTAGDEKVSMLVHNITIRKQAEENLLEAKNKAEEMTKLKSSFLANMSHEIRTPLSGIMGFAELIVDEYGSIEGLREYAQLLLSSSKRLLQTITSILEISKLEAGKASTILTLVNPASIVQSIMPGMQVIAQKKGIELTFTPLLKGESILIEESIYEQMANNLIGNALKFTREGEVHVSLQRVTQRDESFVVLHVRDTGEGIAEEFFDKVFDPFQQESSGMDRGYEGSGLGLSIVRRYAEMYGGKIEFDSEKGVGTEFRLYLPVTS